MATIEYKNLPADLKASAYDAVFATIGEYQARFGQKPPLTTIKLGHDDLQVADLYVQAQTAKNSGQVAIGDAYLQIDPKAFSASIAKLGAYLTANKLDAVTASDAREFFTGDSPTGSLMRAAIEAALGNVHF